MSEKGSADTLVAEITYPASQHNRDLRYTINRGSLLTLRQRDSVQSSMSCWLTDQVLIIK